MVLLPEGGQLTVTELRDIAARQQQQIEAQQQLLVAKEQRLKFLKQQEARHHPEADRLRNLREKVEVQELKLRRLRALRGQVEQQRANNSNLGAELESIRALFNEKEKELSLAVAKVEELTRQLEDVRRGNLNGNKNGATNSPSAAALELEKLKKELLYRAKLNEQQTARIAQQRETLSCRQNEISQVDRRIAELQQRLHKKRLHNQQLHTAALAKQTNRNRQRPLPPNIAAVEPVKRENPDQERTQDDLLTSLGGKLVLGEFAPNKNDPKYQTLPYNTKFSVKLKENSSGEESSNSLEKVSNGESARKAENHEPPQPKGSSSVSVSTSSIVPPPSVTSPLPPPPPMQRSIPSPSSISHLTPRPFNASYLTARLGSSIPVSSSSNSNVPAHPNNSHIPVFSRIRPPSSSNGVPKLVQDGSEPAQQSSRPSSQIPNTSMRQNGIAPPSRIPSTEADNGVDNSNSKLKPSLPPKPAVPVKPIPPPRQTQGVNNSMDKGYAETSLDSVDAAISVLRGSTNRHSHNQSYRERILYYQWVQRHLLKPPLQRLQRSGNQQSEKLEQGSTQDEDDGHSRHPKGNQEDKSGGAPWKKPSFVSVNRRIEMPPAFLFPEANSSSSSSDTSSVQNAHGEDVPDRAVRRKPLTDQLGGLGSMEPLELLDIRTDGDGDSTADSPSVGKDSMSDESKSVTTESGEEHSGQSSKWVKKGNLKTKGSVKNPRRVSFDPLALLLDAALEGELELVKKTAKEVPNPSAANDEGITALHNAICAGHFEIVKFLVEFGCDVNAQDSDGWTPLHCAASCNNLPMVKFLVEHGACIFATTLSDHETAAEKCEEDEEGFDGCSEYLYSVQEKLGILNGGVVYSLYNYESQNPDELSFQDGDMILVLRKGDDMEREWWWSRLRDREGYVPRNLLGLYPRVNPPKDHGQQHS